MQRGGQLVDVGDFLRRLRQRIGGDFPVKSVDSSLCHIDRKA